MNGYTDGHRYVIDIFVSAFAPLIQTLQQRLFLHVRHLSDARETEFIQQHKFTTVFINMYIQSRCETVSRYSCVFVWTCAVLYVRLCTQPRTTRMQMNARISEIYFASFADSYLCCNVCYNYSVFTAWTMREIKTWWFTKKTKYLMFIRLLCTISTTIMPTMMGVQAMKAYLMLLKWKWRRPIKNWPQNFDRFWLILSSFISVWFNVWLHSCSRDISELFWRKLSNRTLMTMEFVNETKYLLIIEYFMALSCLLSFPLFQLLKWTERSSHIKQCFSYASRFQDAHHRYKPDQKGWTYNCTCIECAKIERQTNNNNRSTHSHSPRTKKCDMWSERWLQQLSTLRIVHRKASQRKMIKINVSLCLCMEWSDFAANKFSGFPLTTQHFSIMPPANPCLGHIWAFSSIQATSKCFARI